MKTNNVLNTIAALDFTSIKNKLMDVDSGEGWSLAKADAMEIEYRRFLHLMHSFPGAQASPTKAVDTFWHYHILDTQKYATDCDQVFGCFMHHNPNPDMSASTEEDGVDLMQELYETTFGEAYIRAEAYAVDQDEEAYFAGDAGRGMAPAMRMSGAQPGACWANCMMQAKPASAEKGACWANCMMQAKPSSAEKGACWANCMMQAKPASGKTAGGKQPANKAGAQKGACWANCMMQAKPASGKTAGGKQPANKAGAQKGACWANCMMQAKPASGKTAGGKRPANKAGAQKGACWANCMMQAKPASDNIAVGTKPAEKAGAQKGACWANCMMQKKPLGVASAAMV